MIRDYEAHWFPLIRPAIRAGYFLGGDLIFTGDFDLTVQKHTSVDGLVVK